MATTFSKVLLSGSAQGKGIKVVATATPGTAIHSTGISASVIDEVWLYAYNSDTVDRDVTIEFGGTTSPDNQIKMTIPPKSGVVNIVPGLILTGTGSASSDVKAFASAANVVTISGFVNRIQ